MEKIELTKAQKAAIDYNSGDLLISAAAGSGKTATLTTKIVKLIMDNEADVDEMLIITFTKAAAAEMKQRIYKKLLEERNENIYKNKNKFKRVNQEIIKVLDAEICTIDSFLYKNFRTYLPCLGISTDTEIASEREIGEIEEEVMKEVLDRKFKKQFDDEEKYNIWLNLCDTISQTRDSTRIDSEILDFARKIDEKNIDIVELKKKTENTYQKTKPNSIFDSEIGSWLQKYTTTFAEHYHNVYEKIEKRIVLDEKIYKKYSSILEKEIDFTEKLLTLCSDEISNFKEIAELIKNYKFERLPPVSQKDKTVDSEFYKVIRDKFKKDLKNIYEDFYAYNKNDEIFARDKSYDLINMLLEITDEYFKLLRKRKITEGIMSYHDLEKYSYEILHKNPEISVEIGKKYKYIFIDEYQDTNGLQDDIITQIAKNSKRFMVGDVKQSIYKFRGAEPEIFNSYRKSWSAASTDEKEETNENKQRTIFMSENFRSSEEILEFTNLISNQIFPYSDVTFDENDLLKHGRKEKNDQPAKVEIVLINKIKGNNDEDSDKSYDLNLEAEYVAECISKQIGEYDEKCEKIIEASDIAILMRGLKSHSEDYIEALSKRGIKSYVKKSELLEKFSVIKLIICMLEAVNNPLDDVYFAGILYSNIFKFNLDEIEFIRKKAEDMPLFVGAMRLCQDNNSLSNGEYNTEYTEIAAKCTKVIEWLDKEKLLCGSLEIEKYIEKFITNNEIILTEEAESDPNERDAIYKFLDLSREFAKSKRNSSSDAGLSAFLEFAHEEIKNNKRQNEDDVYSANGVVINSIHSSKGLEYPICYIVETSKRISDQDERKSIILDKELGIGMKLSDNSGLAVTDTIYRKILAKKLSSETVSEEMRMFYVASTRARERLILTAVVNDAEACRTDGYITNEIMDKYTALYSSKYIDWITSSCIEQNSNIYNYKIVNENEVLTINEDKNIDNSDDSDIDDSEFKHIEFIGKYENDLINRIPAKVSASDLNSEFLDKLLIKCTLPQYGEDSYEEDSEERIEVLPKFMSGANDYSATDYGNAMHIFMQFMNINELEALGADEEIERLVRQKFISEKYAEIINRKQVEKFLQSSLFKKMKETALIKREFRFNVLVPAKDYVKNADIKNAVIEKNIKLTVQGVVDCVLRDPDTKKLELIDYKTDSLTSEEYKNKEKAYKKLIDRHKNQLLAYKNICKNIFEEEIDKIYIYSTVLGELIEVK